MLPRLSVLLVSALLIAPLCPAQDPDLPATTGYVTHVDPSGFDVNGHHILIGPQTGAGLKSSGYVSVGNAHEFVPFVGERAVVFGTRIDKTHSIQAEKFILDPQKPGEVSGFGIIDALVPGPKDAKPGDMVVRADGYPILIAGNTKVSAEAPLTATSPVTTNMWLGFHGHQRADGIVVADKVSISQNVIKPNESKMLANADFDPDQVDPDAQQGGLSKLVRGRDPKQIPPYANPAMQARVSSLGARLVPAYQRDLPASDPTKIVFRFQLVDQKGMERTISQPSGVILVPRTLVERTGNNDALLAAILADAIAGALEKQAWRGRYAAHAAMATEVGGILVLGLVPTLTGSEARAKIAEHREDQRSRVSLGLLHDAGFDLTEAPRAWWLLNGKPGKDPSQIKLPRRTGVLYDQFSTTWRQTVSPAH